MTQYRQEEKSDESIAKVLREIEEYRQSQKDSTQARTAASLRRRLSQIEIQLNDTESLKTTAKNAILEARGGSESGVSEAKEQGKASSDSPEGFSGNIKSIMQRRRSLVENKETEAEKGSCSDSKAASRRKCFAETEAKIHRFV